MKKNKYNDITLFLIVAALLITALISGIRANASSDTVTEYSVTVILSDSANDRWNNLKTGLHDGAEEFSQNLSIIRVSTDSADEIIQVMKTELSYGTDAFVCAVPFCEGLDEMIPEIAASVPVIMISNTIETDTAVGAMTIDAVKAGETLVTQAMRNGSVTSLGIIAGSSYAASIRQEMQGITNKMTEYAIHPGWIAYDTDHSTDTLAALQRASHADVLIALDNDSLEDAIDYKLAHPEDTTPLIGIGVSNKCIYYTDLETVKTLIFPNEYQMGYNALRQIYSKLHDGKSPGTEIISYSLLTKANLFTTKNQELLFPISR